jgi:hypothetical protein
VNLTQYLEWFNKRYYTPGLWGIWEMREGKTFLKRNGWDNFKEVELKVWLNGKKEKVMQIVPKENRLF